MSDCTNQNAPITNPLSILDNNYFTKKSEFYYYLWKLENKTITGGTTNVKVKSGVVSGGSFVGNPKTYNVTFVSPFSADYSVSIMGDDVRVWSYENKTLNGFTINSNANQTLVGDIYWQAILNGEF